MSYWEDPVACFNEVYRILKSGGTAIFFEPQQGVDVDEVVKTIRANLADASKVRQFAAVSLNKFALRRGDRVGLNLYSKDEILRIANQSRFTEHVSIEKTTLQNLPIFLRIRLTRVA